MSPHSATSGRSPFRIPTRGMTQPIRARHPSPELTNLDCAFPPFPTMSSRSVAPVSDARSQNSDGESLYVKEHAEPYNNISPPASRQGTPDPPFARRGSASSSDSRKRSKTLTSGQDAVRRPSTTASNRRPSVGSVSGASRPDIRNAPALPSPLISVINGLPSPTASESAIASPGFEEPEGAFSNPPCLEQSQESKFLSPIASRPRDYAPFSKTMEVPQGMPNRDALRAEAPTRKGSEDSMHPAQGRGAPTFSSNGPAYRAKRPPPLSNQPLNCTTPTETHFKKPSLFPERSPTLPLLPEPTQSSSLGQGQLTRRPSEPSSGPPDPWPLRLPTIQAYTSTPSEPVAESRNIDRSGSNHSPADSASSYESVSSVVQESNSSRSSAPAPEVFPFKRNDQPSALDDPQQMHSEPLPQPTAPVLNYQADSPTDPLFQQGRLTPVPAEGVQRTELAPEPIVRTATAPLEQTYRAPPPRPQLQRSKTTGTSKGQCRGCSTAIAAGQKSVSSADGRLTGRYHKDCFSCTTCHSPFTTADFYVHHDKPYCAPHYHAVNGSLCGGCGHGIEGQYLEAMRNTVNGQEKFHPHCLTCVLCRTVLKGDYFAHDGRFFCERDIQRVAGPPRNRSPQYPRSPPTTRMGPGPSQLSAPSQRPGRYPERRTTKLMMM